MAETLTHPEPEALTELTLDNHKLMAIDNLLSPNAALNPLSHYKNLIKLSLSNCQLHSLNNFPNLPSLQKLLLMDNRIVNGLDALVNAQLSSLERLDLSNNRIADLEALRPLTKLPSLQHLGLLQCPVTNKPGYRDAVFSLLPNLRTLDDLDKLGEDFDESEEEDAEEDDEQDELDEYEDDEADAEGNDDDELDVIPQQRNQPGDSEDIEEYSEEEDDEQDAEGEDEEEEDEEEEDEEDEGVQQGGTPGTNGGEEEEEEDGYEEPSVQRQYYDEGDDDEEEEEALGEDDEEEDEEEGTDASHPHMGNKGLPSNQTIPYNGGHEAEDDGEDFGDDDGNIGLDALLSNQPLEDDQNDFEFQPGPDLGDVDFIDEEDPFSSTEPGYIPNGNKRKRSEFDEETFGYDFLNAEGELGGDIGDDWLQDSSKRQKS